MTRSAMPVLVALETSSRRPSVAARLDDRLISRELASERAHASDLVPALDELLRELGVGPEHLAGLIVGTGPGSYTGLRVGIATAFGLARASGAALRGVPSGEALAFGELAPDEEGSHLLDARQEGFYFARYRRERDEVRVLEAPRVLGRAELAAALGGPGTLFTEAALLESDLLDPAARERARMGVVPNARALLELGAARLERLGGQAPESIEPLYLRAFAAKPRRRS